MVGVQGDGGVGERNGSAYEFSSVTQSWALPQVFVSSDVEKWMTNDIVLQAPIQNLYLNHTGYAKTSTISSSLPCSLTVFLAIPSTAVVPPTIERHTTERA